jgi:hypothetical protein
MVCGEFPWCLVGGRLNSVGAVVCGCMSAGILPSFEFIKSTMFLKFVPF